MSGRYKGVWIINTNASVQFTDGTANVNVSGILSTYKKTLLGAFAQIGSASAIVITSCRKSDENTVQIKCTNLTGTPYSGTIGVGIYILVA